MMDQEDLILDYNEGSRAELDVDFRFLDALQLCAIRYRQGNKFRALEHLFVAQKLLSNDESPVAIFGDLYIRPASHGNNFSSFEAWSLYREKAKANKFPPLSETQFMKLLARYMMGKHYLKTSRNVRRSGRFIRGYCKARLIGKGTNER
jgi:hypothetical protein